MKARRDCWCPNTRSIQSVAGWSIPCVLGCGCRNDLSSSCLGAGRQAVSDACAHADPRGPPCRVSSRHGFDRVSSRRNGPPEFRGDGLERQLTRFKPGIAIGDFDVSRDGSALLFDSTPQDLAGRTHRAWAQRCRFRQAIQSTNRFRVVPFLIAASGMPVSKVTRRPPCRTARANKYTSVNCRGP